MKSAVIFTAAIAFAQAISLREEEIERQEVDPMMEGEERTIIGFLFDGFEFGDLWVGLTDDQREEIKTAVFNKALEFGGFKPADYPDLDFYLEEDVKSQPENEEKTDEMVLAECHRGGWGGCGPWGFGCGPRCGGWGGCGGPWGGCCGPCFGPRLLFW